MLIIEGCDKLGKTTFAQRIVKRVNEEGRWPAIYQHFTKLPTAFKARDYAHYIVPWTVMDRFHMSDLAYGFVDGRKPRLDAAGYEELDLMVMRGGGLTVVLTAAEGDVERRFLEHHGREEMYDAAFCEKVSRAYRCICNREAGVALTGGLTVEPGVAYWPEMRMEIRLGAGKQFPDDADLERVVDTWRSLLEMFGMIRAEPRAKS